jgi:dolichol-phosphate mannosyltransferase
MTEKQNDVEPSTLVLVAALNEEEGIRLTLEELRQYVAGSRFLVVDGNSRDQTVHIAKRFGADVLHQEGKGKGDAIGYALKHLDENFDYVVLTDGDYTYPAEYVPQMIRILEENPKVGMVCGNRFNSHLHLADMRNVFYFGNRLIAFTHNLLNGVAMHDPLTGLRVVRGNLIKSWRPKSDGFDVEVELNHHVERRGYRIAEIEIPYRERVGEKKLKLKDGIVILKRILTESVF